MSRQRLSTVLALSALGAFLTLGGCSNSSDPLDNTGILFDDFDDTAAVLRSLGLG